MQRIAARLLPLALLLLLVAGCAEIGETEAQLEFERLRRRTITPSHERILPEFKSEPRGTGSPEFARHP